MNQFFYSDKISNDNIILSDEEAYHALKVLRKNQGDKIFVVDGKGGLYETALESDNIKKCRLKILDEHKEFEKPNHYIHIAISPPKNHGRIEWFVEKSVEIGIQEISFIHSHCSERNNIKLNRIKNRAISSMKQSLRAYLPKINDMINFQDFINNCNNLEKYVGYLKDDNVKLLSNVSKSENNYCVLIGPEGDFTLEEIDDALDSGFQCISLGKSRLRTETAGMVACHALNILNQ